MDVPSLRKWLAEPRTALITAVAQDVRAHVATLRSRAIAFYGYALLPGEPYDIHSLSAVANAETDIEVPPSDPRHRYHRYCVDEWKHWDAGGFAMANALLVEANERFASMHTKGDDDYSMDEFETGHAQTLLDAVLRGLEAAKANEVFGGVDPFLAVWISGSAHPIITESVRRLNAAPMIDEFYREFG